MALMRRTRGELDWPEWFGRRMADWPTSLRELLEAEGAEMRVEEFEEEEDGTLVVRAEMPGLDPAKDVEVTVSDQVLRITAERRQESKVEDKRGYRSEFRYGSFLRSVALPSGATADDVKATYNDGILEVRVPVDTEQASARKVVVSRG
jgi:HSP20 family protein